MKKITLLMVAFTLFAACTKEVKKPQQKKDNAVMRKRSNPIDDRPHY